jgi:ring-1,2-phenylacetyl-CoA epoxidase subunit PaaD
MVTVTLDQVRSVVESIPDPEIPVLSIGDLGIVRDVADRDGRLVVTITPTYSGCPAMDLIREQVEAAVGDLGFDDAVVETVHAPAWTTDWMSEEAKARLEAYGIAPPGRVGTPERIRCPQCGSDQTDVISAFGSTACKALWRCTACLEPFDHFKVH